MKQTARAEQIPVIGIHTFRNYDTSSPEADLIECKIQNHIKELPQWAPMESRGEFLAKMSKHRKIYFELKQQLEKYFVREKVVTNLVVTVGRSVLAQRLSNITTYTGIINYGALGSGSTTPVNGDTQLQTEVFRKVVASASATANVSFIDFFYAKADTNGTYNEFGTFIDGSGSANSGQMFTHALTGGWTKSSSESMTVSAQYTFS